LSVGSVEDESREEEMGWEALVNYPG
jgi:hypothetical protein